MHALGLTWTDTWQTVVVATLVYVTVIAFTRLFGQRQFAQFTSYDLPFSFAMGSLIGRVILVRTTLSVALLGIATMFLLHAVSGWIHHHVPAAHRLMQNRPVALIVDGRMLEENIERASTSPQEVHEQMRRSGVASMRDVQLAVMERTGAISILKAGVDIDDDVVSDVVFPERQRR